MFWIILFFTNGLFLEFYGIYLSLYRSDFLKIYSDVICILFHRKYAILFLFSTITHTCIEFYVGKIEKMYVSFLNIYDKLFLY